MSRKGDLRSRVRAEATSELNRLRQEWEDSKGNLRAHYPKDVSLDELSALVGCTPATCSKHLREIVKDTTSGLVFERGTRPCSSNIFGHSIVRVVRLKVDSRER